jgi:hypothetical protein
MKAKVVSILIAVIGFTVFFGATPPSSVKQMTAMAMSESDTVYICTGKYSTKYHRYDSCRGLNNCQSTIKSVTIETAKGTYKRVACRVCW